MYVLTYDDYTDDIWEYFDSTVKFVNKQNLSDINTPLIIRYNPCNPNAFLEELNILENVIILYGFPTVDISTDIGDHFIFTNKKSFNEGVIRYTSDFCQYLPELPIITQKSPDLFEINSESDNSLIGICIDSTWDSPLMINKLHGLITEILNMYPNAIIHFICIDTSHPTNYQVTQQLYNSFPGSIYFEYTRHNITELLQFIYGLDMIISGNYHISLLSLHINIPTISMSIGGMSYLETDVNSCHIILPSHDLLPCNIPVYEILKYITSTIKTDITPHVDIFTELYNYTDIHDFHDFHIKRTIAPFYVSTKYRSSIVLSIIDNLCKNYILYTDKNLLLSGSRLSVFDPSDTTIKSITEEIMWYITGDPYGYMFDDIQKELLIGSFTSLLHKYITIYYSKSKKYSNILNNSCFHGICPDLSGVTLDMYTEKTFNWNRAFYIKKGIIPFKTPWIGYIHHETTFHELERNPLFIESLKTCKTLVKSSELCKPIETPILTFSLYRFHANKTKNLINITSNPSNVSDFYEIYISEKSWVHDKCITKSIHPFRYSLPLLAQIDQPIQFTSSDKNIYQSMIYTIIERLLQNVTIISIDNYDLLSNNVVFIEYIEQSLVLIDIIECIVRNTPFIIAKNPVTIAILGEDYPLFYTTPFDIDLFITNTQYIDIAHEYLTNIDKTKFTHDYFSKYISRLYCT